MSILSFLHFLKKPLTETAMIDGMKVKVFKRRNLMRVLDSCPNGSVVMINARTRVTVYHPDDVEV